MSDNEPGDTSTPPDAPAPAEATAAPVYPMREIIVPGGKPVQMRSDLAVPPGCSIQGS